jgi:hypothetical protein
MMWRLRKPLSRLWYWLRYYIDNFLLYGRECDDYEQECIDEMDLPHYCLVCGSRLDAVRPGSWQCPRCE